MSRLMILGLVMIIIATAYSCTNKKADILYPSQAVTCAIPDTVSYTKDILPIVQSNCYSPGNGCHDQAGSETSGFNYETYTDLSSNALNGTLLGDINWQSGFNEMPKDAAKLSDCDIEKFTKWVNEGAPDN